MGTQLHEHGPTVGLGVDVGRDLDALHRAALVRLEGQGDVSHDARMLLLEPLHLLLVVEKPAVRGAPAGQRQRSCA
jgi:hypothetical protein